MPKKGQKQTKEAKLKISLANKGRKYPHASLNSIFQKGSKPWNTGLKMSEEHCNKLSVAHKGKKQPHIGVPRTQETKNKISNSMKGLVKSAETRKKHSNNMIYKMKMKIIPNKDTKIERLMREELENRKLIYTSQFKYELGIADFMIMFYDRKVIIECDGQYWHSKSEVIERDKKKNAFLENQGYQVFRFTDKEILADVKSCVDKVLNESRT